MTVSIVFDIVCVAIIVICALYFASKGLLAGLLSLASTLISLAVAFFGGRALSPKVFEWLFRDRLIENTYSAIEEHAVSNIRDLLGEVVGFLPDFVKEPIIDQFGDFTIFDSYGFAARVVDEVIAPIVIPIITVILIILIFVLLRLLFNILIKLLRGVNRVPVLGAANRIMGGVAGLLVGLLYVFLLVVVLSAMGFLYDADTGGFFGRSIFYRLFSNIRFFPSTF